MAYGLVLSGYFNPLSPHGERPRSSSEVRRSSNFNPLSPHGERRQWRSCSVQLLPFQSTLPAWGETHEPQRAAILTAISIHSPRMGRDVQNIVNRWRGTVISIHSPRMGRDADHQRKAGHRGISIHSPRMGRDVWPDVFSHGTDISIHSPRMGRDAQKRRFAAKPQHFNPLSPHGERPRGWRVWLRTTDFNPLSPHGERPGAYSNQSPTLKFQSTLPAWGETETGR